VFLIIRFFCSVIKQVVRAELAANGGRLRWEETEPVHVWQNSDAERNEFVKSVHVFVHRKNASILQVRNWSEIFVVVFTYFYIYIYIFVLVV
jgi:hypothetical protein